MGPSRDHESTAYQSAATPVQNFYDVGIRFHRAVMFIFPVFFFGLYMASPLGRHLPMAVRWAVPCAFVLLLVWAGFRSLRIGVTVSPLEIEIRGMTRVRNVLRRDVTEIAWDDYLLAASQRAVLVLHDRSHEKLPSMRSRSLGVFRPVYRAPSEGRMVDALALALGVPQAAPLT